MLKRNSRQEFVDRFTFEMILSLVARMLQREKFRVESERLKTVIETEKLRQKFSKDNIQNSLRFESQKAMQNLQKSPIRRDLDNSPRTIEINLKPNLFVNEPLVSAQNKIPMVHPEGRNDMPFAQAPQIKIQKTQGEIDFGKLETLINDKLISYIECSAPDTNVIIKKSGNTIKTQITLNREEIIALINSFSETVHIPIIEGMLIARWFDLEMSAVTSETLDPSFIIKRDDVESPIIQMNSGNPNMQRMPYPQNNIPRMPMNPGMMPRRF